MGRQGVKIRRWNVTDFDRHGLIEAPHPAARKEQPDFRASKTLSRVNDLLVEFGRQPIRWADL